MIKRVYSVIIFSVLSIPLVLISGIVTVITLLYFIPRWVINGKDFFDEMTDIGEWVVSKPFEILGL